MGQDATPNWNAILQWCDDDDDDDDDAGDGDAAGTERRARATVRRRD
jgi:hypothetical protein